MAAGVVVGGGRGGGGHLLSGAQPADVVALASVADPASLETFVELARQRASSTAGAPGPQ
jgi:hypothetical protein